MTSPGAFEIAVLLATQRLGDEAYAVPMREEIERLLGRAVSRGALYTTLARLEAKGLLGSRMGEPLAMRGGKSRRYYRVSAAGVRVLRAARGELNVRLEGLGRLLEGLP